MRQLKLQSILRLHDQTLPIDRVTDRRAAHATKAGGQGTRYTVHVGPRQLYLFLDEDRRWFVEEERNVREIPYYD